MKTKKGTDRTKSPIMNSRKKKTLKQLLTKKKELAPSETYLDDSNLDDIYNIDDDAPVIANVVEVSPN